jgi:hypothetical protein
MRLSHTKSLVSRQLKFPIFILGLFIMIVGAVTVTHFGLPVDAIAATVALGFILFFLGIVLD